MSKPTSNTEIKQIIAITGIKAELKDPPKEFIAVLTSSGTEQTYSMKFRYPSRATNDVIFTLIKNLEIAATYAEHTSATLDWLIQEAMSMHESKIKIAGNEIRYLGEPDSKGKGDTKWKYLDKATSIQIFANDPFSIEDDAETVAANTAIIKNAIMREIEAEQAKILATQKRLGNLGKQLELLQ